MGNKKEDNQTGKTAGQYMELNDSIGSAEHFSEKKKPALDYKKNPARLGSDSGKPSSGAKGANKYTL